MSAVSGKLDANCCFQFTFSPCSFTLSVLHAGVHHLEYVDDEKQETKLLWLYKKEQEAVPSSESSSMLTLEGFPGTGNGTLHHIDISILCLCLPFKIDLILVHYSTTHNCCTHNSCTPSHTPSKVN